MVSYPYHIEIHPGGPCIVWYRDDYDNSGYGDNPEINYWWGATISECENRAKLQAPKTGWIPLLLENFKDHATLTGMYDRY